jgi:diguanylate cyclase (GGDEF)-like protein
MLVDAGINANLDVPTLSVAAICIAATLGLCLIFAWLQQRSVRAFARWGSAYLIGASSMALWSEPTHLFRLPPVIPAALIFIACGMIWNGVRVFHGRRLLPLANFAGAIVWVIVAEVPLFPAHSMARVGFGIVVVAAYTFAIAFELARERRKSLYSKPATIVVPCLHAGIFLLPLAMRAFLPDVLAAGWLTVFALESMIYAVGTAVIMLLTVKDHAVAVHRNAASTDSLTGLLNRRAFLENARSLCMRQGKRGEPVTLMMFDLDYFKAINDRFSHTVGDDVLRLFAQVVRANTRANDIIGRLGGEEFAAIVPGDLDLAILIAERIRANFEISGVMVGENAIGATVSIGAAVAWAPVMEVGPLLVCADAALYRAKRDGRNRVCAVGEEPVMQEPVAAARHRVEPVEPARILQLDGVF